MFFADLALLQLIQTIRSDHTLYTRYQNSTKLVALINSFARTNCQFPQNWEKRVDPVTNKVGVARNAQMLLLPLALLPSFTLSPPFLPPPRLSS